MSSVTINEKMNRMFITFEGFMTLEESTSFLNECVQMSKKLKSGYTVLTDTTRLKVLPQNVWEVIQKIRDNHIERGISKSAIIIDPQNNISNMQVKRTLKNMENPFCEEYFINIYDPNKFLEA